MKSIKTSLIRILELFVAGLLLALTLFLLDYICPERIFNLLPEKVIGDTLEVNNKNLKALDQLVRDGKIMSPKDLYEHLIEYYHFLFTMLFGVLGAVAALVYFQIKKSEHMASIETAQKIDKQIEDLNIPQKIDEAILKEGLSEILFENVLSSQEEYIKDQLREKMVTFSEETNNKLEAALRGIETDLEKIKEKFGMENS